MNNKCDHIAAESSRLELHIYMAIFLKQIAHVDILIVTIPS